MTGARNRGGFLPTRVKREDWEDTKQSRGALGRLFTLHGASLEAMWAPHAGKSTRACRVRGGGYAGPMSRHARKSLFLLVETLGIFAGLACAAAFALRSLPAGVAWPAMGILAVLQGLWFDRMYTVSHEAVHGKLFPTARRLNDLVGALLVTPILAPFTIYRRIHGFHHGGNRRDPETAALDHFKVPAGASRAVRLRCRILWSFYVFGGGFFLHSLVTVLVFLAVPRRAAERISPLFRAWPMRLRLRAWAEFAGGLALHAAVWLLGGATLWLALLGLPLLVFAWVWSLLLYIYHYRTPVGPDVRHNVRSLPPHPFFSWLLLNFNEHATHHRDPSIPWYALPERRYTPPSPVTDARNVWQAVWQQRRGPILWSAD